MKITGGLLSEEREWLLTNGLGGYASSTLLGINSRRYHALLVAAFSPEDRRVLVPKVDEIIELDGKNYRLSENRYLGHEPLENHIVEFEAGPSVLTTYDLEGVKLEKEIFMPHDMNAVVVKYSTTKAVKISGNILTTSRDHNWTLKKLEWEFKNKKTGDVLTLTPTHDKPPTISIALSKGELTAPETKSLVRNLHYKKDSERGFDSLEDVLIGASMLAEITPTRPLYLVISAALSNKESVAICRKVSKNPEKFKDELLKRKAQLVDDFYVHTQIKKRDSISNLVSASDNFLTNGGVIAGYPWFGVWGRDSLISLPGLCLMNGRNKEARDIISKLLVHIKDGRIPNNFIGEPSYNSADASLWLFWALWKYLKTTEDYKFAKKIWPTLKKILASYARKCDTDGLVVLDSNMPKTWMDAIVDGTPVTLRSGKPVEIQALWYNALMVGSHLANKFGGKDTYKLLGEECYESFNEKFWNDETKYLYDVIGDGSIRPNALFAVSLPFPILEEKRWRSVVGKAERELLTPYGLRTLAPSDSRYKGSAKGSPTERDLAYHQGDAWPWLIGPFIDAYSKAYPERSLAKFVEPLLVHLEDACLGGISEIFGGSDNEPEGCINQAWSVAELMRILHEHPLGFS